MKTVLRKMGNSQGIIIPKPFLNETGLKKEVELRVEGNVIIISRPKQKIREGWAEASKALAKQGEDALVWPEFPNDDDRDLKW